MRPYVLPSRFSFENCGIICIKPLQHFFKQWYQGHRVAASQIMSLHQVNVKLSALHLLLELWLLGLFNFRLGHTSSFGLRWSNYLFWLFWLLFLMSTLVLIRQEFRIILSTIGTSNKSVHIKLFDTFTFFWLFAWLLASYLRSSLFFELVCNCLSEMSLDTHCFSLSK